METTKTLSKRERQVAKLIAWGASLKEVADHLNIAFRTADNTCRKIKAKLNVNKNTEISAWWFCTEYNISMDLSPLARKTTSTIIVAVFLCGELLPLNLRFTLHRPSRRARHEVRNLRKNTSVDTSCYLF